MLRHHPKRREVVKCDFSGLSAPEMCKVRPVVIVSVSPARPGLFLLVPLSTTPPTRVQPWHHRLSDSSNWAVDEMWVKCDMVYAMRYARLSYWGLGRDINDKRIYLTKHLVTPEDFQAIKAGIRAAIG